MKLRRLFCALLLVACDGGGEGTDAGTPPVDAGDTPPPICADAATTYAFPSPTWIGADHLVVPENDRAGDAVRFLEWTHEIEAITGWPRRPTWVVPLDRPAGAVDASHARVAVGDGSGSFTMLDVPVIVEAVSSTSLTVTPRDPLPYDAVEVILALEAGVAGDAHAIPICEGGAPHPDQVAAAEAVGVPVDVALRLALARGPDALVALQARLAATPALVVESAEAAMVADLDADHAPTVEDAPAFAPTYLRGVLALPDYRHDGAAWELDADGGPAPNGTTRPGFIVVLPATGTAPYPVVLYQHGGGQNPLDVFAIGADLAAEGFAFVAIDLPGHGNRVGPTGGGDLDFIDFDSPLHTRENFRQAAADHLTVLSGLAAIEAAVETNLGVSDALDEGTRYYMGMSLGAVSGSLTTASARGLTGAALFVGGAGYPELMNHGLFAVAAARVLRGVEPQPSTMLAVVETIGDGADPLAYAIAAEDRDAPPTPILFLQAVDDPLIAHRASEQWARAFGASLARPIDHETVGFDEVDLPVTGTFSFEGSTEVATRVLVQNPMSEIVPGMRHAALVRTDYMRAMVTRCFVSARDDGQCEVIDTGFADR
ncbi:MAG: hypothetical protein H6719_25600 [Sandaracinaceae bacterium]|nr:hypothetical protein [Sandaracinaceae bacterium]